MIAVDRLAYAQTILCTTSPHWPEPTEGPALRDCCTSPPASSAAADGSGSGSTGPWPWAAHLAVAFTRCAALPQPAH